jgi:uncharacterized protein YodC (DUF2158 family)
MAKRSFKTGDGVQLASGGPHMTVIGRTRRGLECCWFDNDHKERRSVFPSATLAPERVDDLTDEELLRRIATIERTGQKPGRQRRLETSKNRKKRD